MKLTGTLPRIVWVLLGLLVISAFVFTMGANETNTFPSADSYRPSGARAFSDLLAKQGYQIEVTEDPSPRLNAKTDVLIGFSIPKEVYGTDIPDEDSGYAQPFISHYVMGGGEAAIFCLSGDFESASESAESNLSSLSPPNNARARLNVNVDETTSGLDYGQGVPLSTAPGSNGPVAASVESISKGQMLVVGDGIVATNRFIGRNDNAEQVIRWISAIAPPGSRLVFYEASFGNSSPPTVFTKLGPWSSAAWLQGIFLFVVVVYSLGKPFGYPDEVKKTQRGARDLVDAVAQLYRRAKAGGLALRKVYEDADHELRNRLKLPSEASEEERDRYLPQELVDTLHRIASWSYLKLRPDDALEQTQRLDMLMSEFLGDRRRTRIRKVRKF